MVYADAQCHTASAALLDESLQVVAIEAIVARIDTHLINIIGCYRGNFRYEVYVCNHRRRVAVGTQSLHDFGKRLALLAPLRRQSHDGCAGVGYALDLGDARLDVGRCRVGHRLYGNRVGAAYNGVANLHLAGAATRVLV